MHGQSSSVLKACGFHSFLQEWCFCVAFWRTESKQRWVWALLTQKGWGCEVVVGTGTARDPWAPWPPPGPAVGTCAPRNKCLPQAVISKPESLACPARVCVPSIVKRKQGAGVLGLRVGPRVTGSTQAGWLALRPSRRRGCCQGRLWFTGSPSRRRVGWNRAQERGLLTASVPPPQRAFRQDGQHHLLPERRR